MREELFVNYSFGNKDHYINAFDAVLSKNFMEKINSIIKRKKYSLFIESEMLALNIKHHLNIIKIFEGKCKVYNHDSLILIHKKGLIKLLGCMKNRCFYVSPKIFCRSFADYDQIDKFLKDIFKPYIINMDKTMKINYYHFTGICVETREVNESYNESFYPEAYPYINNIDDYIDQFINSKESALLLKGSPGTGKTRLIKHILKKTADKYADKIKIAYTSDKHVLNTSRIFSDFIWENIDALVIEDIDYDLDLRSLGNTLMYKLLGYSDGIVSGGSKKIILSTNLPSVKNIDPALLRPGRCFDVINLRNLNKDESYKFLNNFNIDPVLSKDNYSLAELYKIINSGNENIKAIENNTAKLGFCA